MKESKKYFYVALSSWLILGVLIAGYAVKAWVAPTTNAPGANVAKPINISNTAQEMTGSLTVASLVDNGTSLFKGLATYTPISNSTSIFNITNAAGTSIFKVDSTNARVGVNVAVPSSAFDVTGGINASGTVAGNAVSATNGISGASCTVGSIAGTAGTLLWTGDINSTTGNISTTSGQINAGTLCIASDCKTSWPSGGDPIPSGGSIISTLPALAGYTSIPGNTITSSNATVYGIFTKP